MIKQKVTLGGSLPLSQERALALARLANSFSASILLTDDVGTYNGKSLLGMLSLGVLGGRELTILAEGRDADLAVEALSRELASQEAAQA